MDNNIPTTQIDQKIYEYAITEIGNGKSNDEVVSMMKQHGVNAKDGLPIVEKLRLDMAQAKQDRAKRDIRNGALWSIGGLAVTGLSYASASGSGGGSYFVCWGAVIFGGIQLIRGLSASGNIESEQRNDESQGPGSKGWG
jgi:hypothetical protein